MASDVDSETTGRCLVHSVANSLATEPLLEAVTIDQKSKSISVATLGKPRDPDLEARVAATIQRAQQASGGRRCGLLEGEQDCAACDVPFAPFERETIAIRRDAHSTTISRITCPTAPSFWHWRRIPWPTLTPREVETFEDGEGLEEWKFQLAAALLCGGFALAAWLLPSFRQIGFVAAYVFGSWFAMKEVWELLHRRKLDVHFLMLAVAAGSASIGAWGEGAVLLFLFSVSGALEHYVMGRTQREIRSLFKSAPKTATVFDDSGRETELPIEQILPGMRLLIRPDAQFPVDAEIIKGTTAADESNLTGESVPVEKETGDTVLAGTLNLWGAVEVKVTRPASESALQKIIRLIRDAQHLKAPAQRLTDKFGTPYTYGILGLCLVMFLVWWRVAGHPAFPSATDGSSHQTAFYRTMILLVVASPCALVLSIPSAILAAIAWGARHGILFRGGAAVEKLADVDVVALDKTGTLTNGELRVDRIETFPAGREAEMIALLYSVERLSNHPLARAVTRFGKKRQLPAAPVDQFESHPGQGLSAIYGGERVWAGRREWVLQHGVAETLRAAPVAEFGSSEIWVSWGKLTGRVLLRDAFRPEAGAVLKHLREAGLQTVVLTGDHRAAAEHLKNQLELSDVRAGLTPAEKVSAIEAFTRQGSRVAMIGDGVNDAPSLAAAHVGVAMGARGSDAALEQAEIVLMHDRIENFWRAYRLSQRARGIIRQNLCISLGAVAVLVGCALAGAIPLTVGVLGHEGSTVVVVLNSLRLLRGGGREETTESK